MRERWYIVVLLASACGQAGASEREPVEETAEETSEAQPMVEPVEPPEAEHEAEDEAEPAPPPYSCVTPAIPIPRPRECVRGHGYPRCKWQMPHATLSDGRYRRWRNTIMEHWWARPALVATVLAVADAFEQEFPDQVLAIGDLDAPGPRHTTHDRGVDVDIYMLGAMMVENAGRGRYPNNYEGKSEEEVEDLRQRVETLARIFATCTNGQLRIYYNDEVVLERFLAWYEEQGFPESEEFEAPMRKHNRLHEFHFHITVPEELPMPEMAELPEGETHPIARIEEPPPPESAPNLSSMTLAPGERWAPVPRE